MLFIIFAWTLSCIATFWLGYGIRSLKHKIEVLEQRVDTKVNKPVKLEEPGSEILDPEDEVQAAIWEHQQLMARLNGQRKE